MPSDPAPPPNTLDQSGGGNSSSQNNTATAIADDALSPLEQEVLDEYARLLGNLNHVRLFSHKTLSLSLSLSACYFIFL
jgi:hypothetical protein